MRRTAVCLVLLLPLAVDVGAAETMRYQTLSGHRVRLILPAELGESWREVNVGRLQVRTTDKQIALERRRLPATKTLDVTVDGPGCSLLQIDLGPPASRGRADSWQRVERCIKIVACAATGREERRRSGALITAKTGSRIEIRPLFNPAALIAGSDLPVRLYFQGESVQGARVLGSGPDGAFVEAVSDGVGIAFLRIPRDGRWTVSFSHRGATAELFFDLPGADMPVSKVPVSNVPQS